MNWNNQFASRTREMKRTAIRELLKLVDQRGMISFAGGLPAPELFPVEQVRQAADAVMSRMGRQALQYGATEGIPELRDWIARRFSRGARQLQRSNVAIVSGAQQALDLVGRVLLNEGDTVIVEDPTYLALLSAWRPLGVRFLPISSDADGMRVEELASLSSRRPKLVYSTPNFQNPQGTTLSLERRRRLASWLRDHEVGLLEDNPYGELRYDGDPIPDVGELGALPATGSGWESNVIQVGTFSKVLAPGLRVGWVIGAEPVIEKLVQAKQAADLHTSTVNQYLIHELVRDGLLDLHVPILCQAYRERRDTMLAALEKYFPAEMTWTRPEGGMFLMAKLPPGLAAAGVLLRALKRQVSFVPGEEFHLNGGGQNSLRLNFTNVSSDRIEEGMKRLGAVVRDLKTHGRDARATANQ